MMSMTGGGWSSASVSGQRCSGTGADCDRRPPVPTKKRDRDFRNGSAWRTISVLFLALGINKQLDLQTALTEAGRVLARYQGWYEQRQFVQLVVIALFAMTCLIALCCFGRAILQFPLIINSASLALHATPALASKGRLIR